MKKILIVAICMVQFSLLGQAPTERKGLSFGASIGGGVLHFTSGFEGGQTSGDISLPNLKVGWMFNQNLGVFLNAPGQLFSENDKDRSFEALIPSIQYWPLDKLWLSAGLGMAMDFPAFYEVEKVSEEDWNIGKGVLMSIGYEILQKPKWIIDIQSRLLLSSIELNHDIRREGANLAFAVGFNFY